MDDYLCAGSREDLEKIQDLIIRELGKLELEINQDKTVLSPLQRGVDFLGHHISTTIKVKKETRDRMLETLSTRYPEASEEEFWNSVAGMHGHACWANDSITQLTAMCTERNKHGNSERK